MVEKEKIVDLYYNQGLKQKEIAEQLLTTPQYVSKIIKKMMNMLNFKHNYQKMKMSYHIIQKYQIILLRNGILVPIIQQQKEI